MNQITYLIIILIALISCGQRNNETEKIKQENIVKQKYNKVVSDLSNKYSIKYSIDTLRYDYSIQFEDLLNTKYQLISRFKVHDIYNQDSISYVKVKAGRYPSYYLSLRISQTDQKKMLSLSKSYYSRTNAIMVISLEGIKKIDLTFDSFPEDQNYCTIEFESSMSFAGKGQVIEVQTLKE